MLGAARIEKPRKKTGGLKKKYTRQKSAIQALGERAGRYEFLNSLARAPAGIKFGQIANGDIDKVRKELRKIIAKKVTTSAVDVTSEDGQRKVPTNRHQVVKLSVYSDSVYRLLGSRDIPNVMSDTLAENLRLKLSSTKKRIVVAGGSTGDCAGLLEEIPVSFGDTVLRLNFMATKSVPYGLIIASLTLVDICACIDLYHQTVKVSKEEKTETLNLFYEPEMSEDTEDELTVDTESDIGKSLTIMGTAHSN